MAGSGDRYVPLNRLKVHTKVDVYGVVKFFKHPYKSRGSDYCTMVSIVDPSYTDPMCKLKCLLFAKELSKLPVVKLGHIIRFHRMSISEYMGSLQGQNSPGFSWLLFSGDVGAPLEPLKSSSTSYSVTDLDREKVKELRLWASNKDELHEKLCSFNEVTVGRFFDILCQVVSTSVIEPNVGRLLKVWDGTQCFYNVKGASSDCEEKDVQIDDSLMRKAKGCLYDVSVFDNHFLSSTNIRPGDYVKFVNLHAAEYRCPHNSNNSHTMVEFVLHRGDAFGRNVSVILPDDPDLDIIKQRQEIVAMENDSFNFSEALQQSSESAEIEQGKKNQEPVPSTSREPEHRPEQTFKGDKNGSQEKELCVNENNKNSIDRCGHKESEKISKIADDTDSRQKHCRKVSDNGNQEQSNEQSLGESSSEPRCMIQTSTVVTGHHHIKRTKIGQVLQHEVPYKFLARARVYDYHPRPSSVRSFLKLYCSQCHFLCSHPAADCNDNNRSECQLQIGSTFKGITHYSCPQCLRNQESLHGLDSPSHLHYIFMLRCILSDDSGMLMANIWKEEAVKFFQDTEPEDLLKDESYLEQIRDCLNQICPLDKNMEDRPWIECCLQSYSVAQGTRYQMFDTVVV